MKKKTIIILLTLLVIFGAAQLIRPGITNPPVTQDVTVPDSVKAVLRKGCYDCHSNETALKWFDKITPANFMVADHIKEARAVLNFSHWDSLQPPAQKSLLFWALNDVRNGEMPLGSYLLVHTGAKLTEADVNLLQNYLLAISTRKPSDTVAVQQPRHSGPVAPGFNGLAYIPGFENWKAISTTDRFDNGTMRVIYGNDIAVKAIEEKNINPWPDGTVFAKAAWAAQTDSMGTISSGQFIQVEFMVKDSKKYAGTKGWGWGRWRGGALKPYGKDAGFVNECTSCHRPVEKNDFVYTYPLHLSSAVATKAVTAYTLESAFNDAASVPGPAGSAPLQGIVLNSYVNPRHQTMATLYGNKPAADYLLNHADGLYPDGAELTLVTWQQQPDPRWFGGNIPGAAQKVEVVKFDKGPHYASYQCSPWQEVINPDAASAMQWIIKQRMQILP